jgi:AraC-like DNA-binding protein
MTSTPEPCNRRRALTRTGSLVAEELIAHADLPPRGENTRRQVVITFAGAFEFDTGRTSKWVDPSRILFAEADRAFIDRHVVPGMGHQSVILTPDPALLDEAACRVSTYFSNVVALAPPRLPMLIQLLRRATDPLQVQELSSTVLYECFGEGARVMKGADTRRVRQAKSILHECQNDRLTLEEIAEQIGVSPIYLTQAFKRAEGISLYRYQTRLRLSRALDRLRDVRNITELALDLGYSSHSHFSAAFRCEFGVTPSNFRSGSPNVAPSGGRTLVS